mmetsp:Transcript_29794/g.63793  ORF Transcript_29794/g.63793 Transcript_29794/m.63793 type:complete len:80 (-) Transcript_29794:198-437(-)
MIMRCEVPSPFVAAVCASSAWLVRKQIVLCNALLLLATTFCFVEEHDSNGGDWIGRLVTLSQFRLDSTRISREKKQRPR